MNTETAKPAAPRWMRIVLIVSLALNLCVAGVLGGVALRWGGEGGAARFASHALPGDLSFRAAVAALPEADRQEIRTSLRRQFREGREITQETARAGQGVPLPPSDAARGEAQETRVGRVIDALRAPEFDPQVLTEALGAPLSRAHDMAAQGHSALVARVAAMPLAERRAYADRLTQELAERSGRDARREQGR